MWESNNWYVFLPLYLVIGLILILFGDRFSTFNKLVMTLFVTFNIFLIIPTKWMNPNINAVSLTVKIINFGLPFAFALFISIWSVKYKEKYREAH